MTFQIVVDGTPAQRVLRWLEDVLGTDRVVQAGGHVRILVTDQAAMVGALNCINDLGLEIQLVERALDGRTLDASTVGTSAVADRPVV